MRQFVLYLAVSTALAAMPSISRAESASTTPEPVASAGLRVYVDPETGTLVDRPVTDAQRAVATAAVEPSFNQSSEGLVEVVHPSGAIVTDLQGRFEQAIVASRAEDGTLGVTCRDAAHANAGPHGHDAAGGVVAATREER